jgi:signal transduction histidine kinase
MSESMNILVVDDKLENIRLLNDILTPKNYQISFATSGEQALKMIATEHYDLILLDVMMEGIDGFETCRQLKAHERYHDTPVIFITAQRDNASLKQAFLCGAADYINKPINADEVLLRVENQIRIQSLIRQLQAANQSKDRFFSIIAHDLRSPLSSIVQLSDFELERTASDADDMKKIMWALNQSASQTFKLLENLLQWSRAQTGSISFQPEIMHIHVLLRPITDNLKAQAEKKNIALSYECPDVKVNIDVNMIGTVLRNLLSNAIKFCHADATIQIFGELQDNRLWLSVQDTGIGIPQDKLDNLFTLDKNIVRSGTAGEAGSGLGLLLVKEFIQYHQSELKVSSKIDQGTTFRFSLPLA